MIRLPRINRRRGTELRARMKAWFDGLRRSEEEEAAPISEDQLLVDLDAPIAPEEPEDLLRSGRPSNRGNRRRENPLILAVSWLLPMAVAGTAFATPFLGVRMHEYVMHTGHFFVREVVLDGNSRLSDEEILSLADITPGTHVLSADLDLIETRIESHPWIAQVSAERDLPDRLILDISENRPVAYIVLDDLMVVTADGEPFSLAGPKDTADLPIITGLAPTAFDEEETAQVARADVRAAVNLHRLYQHMGLEGRWPIAEIRVSAGRRLSLVLSGTGTEALLGVGPYRESLYRLEWVLEKLHAEGATAEYVLLERGSASSDRRDDGRVILRANLSASPGKIAEEAHERAQMALQKQQEQDGSQPASGTAAPLPNIPPGVLPGNIHRQ